MRSHLLAITTACFLLACGGKDEPSPSSGEGAEPTRVEVDHILIGVQSGRFPQGKRSEEEARKLAYEIYEKLLAGTGDWHALKREHSEDPPPGGPYKLVNTGVEPQRGEHKREGMAVSFTRVAFSLKVDELGVADYEPADSPFGFHIMKRLR